MNNLECYIAWSSRSNAMLCCACSNFISIHLRFTFVHHLSCRVSLWAESLTQEHTRKQQWRITRMHQKAAMDSKLTPNASSIYSRTGHGVGCLHQRSNEGQCMHAMTFLSTEETWCQSRLVHAIHAEDAQVGQWHMIKKGIFQDPKGQHSQASSEVPWQPFNP